MSLVGKVLLVTGASGFLGSSLVARLANEGASVKALARRPHRGKYISDHENIEIIKGDITDPDRMHEVMPGVDVVFHVAAAMAGSYKQQHQVNVAGTRHVIQAAATANVQRFVHVSSIGIYGYQLTADVSEATPPTPTRVPYNRTKLEGEAIVRQLATRHRLPYSIIRPGMIYGPGSQMWTKTIFRLARRNPTPFIGDGSGTTYPIHIDDVIDMMIVLATHPNAENETFHCTPDPSPTWREYLGCYAQLAGHDNWRAIPILLARAIAPLADLVLSFKGELQDVSDIISMIQQPITFKMSKAQDLLDWQPQISLKDGIASCIPYLQEEGLFA